MSVTSSQEYEDLLWKIQSNQVAPTVALLLPSDEKIYSIDLDTRTVEVPDFLSVEHDHQAEVLYFKVDRFFENMDLSNTTCIVSYKNANPKQSEEYVQVVPYFDVITLSSEGKMILPWCIQGPITAYSGSVQFSFKFYQVNSDKEIIYELNTLTAKSKILTGWSGSSTNQITSANTVLDDTTLYQIQEIQKISDKLNIHWLDLT